MTRWPADGITIQLVQCILDLLHQISLVLAPYTDHPSLLPFQDNHCPKTLCLLLRQHFSLRQHFPRPHCCVSQLDQHGLFWLYLLHLVPLRLFLRRIREYRCWRRREGRLVVHRSARCWQLLLLLPLRRMQHRLLVWLMLVLLRLLLNRLLLRIRKARTPLYTLLRQRRHVRPRRQRWVTGHIDRRSRGVYRVGGRCR